MLQTVTFHFPGYLFLLTLTCWFISYESITGVTTPGYSFPASITTSWNSSLSSASPGDVTTPRQTKSLMCYQCRATSADEPCVTDMAGMLNSSTRDIYIKNCTDTNVNLTLCMIQTIEAGGKIIFYHRDCHDGHYFAPPVNSPLFPKVKPNNLTTCDVITDKVVCYRPCNTDFCNGPQLPPNKTDPCQAYLSDPEGVTLAPDQECGARGIFIGSEILITGYLSVTVLFFMIGWL